MAKQEGGDRKTFRDIGATNLSSNFDTLSLRVHLAGFQFRVLLMMWCSCALSAIIVIVIALQDEFRLVLAAWFQL